MPRQPSVQISLDNSAIADGECFELTVHRGTITDFGSNTFDYIDGGVSTFDTITINGIEMVYGSSEGYSEPVVGQLVDYVCHRGRYYAWARLECSDLYPRDLINNCNTTEQGATQWVDFPGIGLGNGRDSAPYPPGFGPCPTPIYSPEQVGSPATPPPNSTGVWQLGRGGSPLLDEFTNTTNYAWRYNNVGFGNAFASWTALSYDESTFLAEWHMAGPVNEEFGGGNLRLVSLLKYDASTCCAIEHHAGSYDWPCGLGGAGIYNSHPISGRHALFDWDGAIWHLVSYHYFHTGNFCADGAPAENEDNQVYTKLYKNNVHQGTWYQLEGAPGPYHAGWMVNNGNNIWLWDSSPSTSVNIQGFGANLTYDTGGMRFQKVNNSDDGYAAGTIIQLKDYPIMYFGNDIGPAVDTYSWHINPVTRHPDGGFWFTGYSTPSDSPSFNNNGLLGYIGPKGVHYATGDSHGLRNLTGFQAGDSGIHHIFPNGDIITSMRGDLANPETFSTGVIRVTDDGIFPVDLPQNIVGLECIDTDYVHPQVKSDGAEYIIWNPDLQDEGQGHNLWYRGYIDSDPTASYPIRTTP